jgi:hypothetical protein
VREADAALVEAEARLQALHDYKVELEAEALRLKSGLALAVNNLQARVADVIRAHPGTLALISRYKATQRELLVMAETLRLLGSTGGTATGALPLKFRNLAYTPLAERIQPAQDWARAVDALLGDADFPLPEG